MSQQSLRLAPPATWHKRLTQVIGNNFFLVCAITVIGILALVYIFVGSQAWETFFQTSNATDPLSGLPVKLHPISPGEFFFSTTWDNATHFGTLIYIIGSFALVGLTLIIAVPLSLGAALFISEYAPTWLRAPLRSVVELFLGIPSVIFGLVGLLFLVPRIRDLLNFLVGSKEYSGEGLIPAAIVVAFMIMPTITTISVDALRAIPQDLREGSLALGATRWQTVSRTLLPAATPGIITGVILGITRALGETLAVAFVIGGGLHLPFGPSTNPYAPIYADSTTTMTVMLLFNFGEATTGTALYNVLWSTSFLLLLISAIMVAISRGIASRRVF
jgi:phosphate transport system permease protein